MTNALLVERQINDGWRLEGSWDHGAFRLIHEHEKAESLPIWCFSFAGRDKTLMPDERDMYERVDPVPKSFQRIFQGAVQMRIERERVIFPVGDGFVERVYAVYEGQDPSTEGGVLFLFQQYLPDGERGWNVYTQWEGGATQDYSDRPGWLILGSEGLSAVPSGWEMG